MTAYGAELVQNKTIYFIKDVKGLQGVAEAHQKPAAAQKTTKGPTINRIPLLLSSMTYTR